MKMPFRNNSPQEEMSVDIRFSSLSTHLHVTPRIARETLLAQTILDSLDDELTNDNVVAREKAMDVEFVKLVQVACKANNIPRAIELTKLLHNIAAFDAVMKIADFYHLPGLKEKMAMIKEDREEAEDRLILARSKRRRWLKPEPPLRQLTETSSSARFDPLGDSRPPPTIERPGMARVTVPVIETTRYSGAVSAAQTQEQSPWNDSSIADSPPPTDTKRKRPEVDDIFPSSDFSMPPPKQSVCKVPSSSYFLNAFSEPNPFARKTDANKHPFARKSEAHRTIQKSESFFDKMETDKKPRKCSLAQPAYLCTLTERSFSGPAAVKGSLAKEKKEAPKQATLFGMMSKSEKVQKVKNKTTRGTPESEQETQVDSQTTDVAMSDLGSLDNSETQEDSQVTSTDWEETQLLDESISSHMVASEA